MAGPLGKKVDAPSHYAPEILFPILRSQQRHEKNLIDQDGFDIWNIHELFWLNLSEQSHHDQISIHIPANSRSTIESKSMKLFINSLIHRRFKDLDEVKNEIKAQVEAIVEAKVIIDAIHTQIKSEHTQVTVSKNLTVKKTKSNQISMQKFGGFRSLCPVTSQPDIAEILIESDIHKDDMEGISCYLGSFFERECFHELCVEFICNDLVKAGFKVNKVEGFFERRGGIAIIPIRYPRKN